MTYLSMQHAIGTLRLVTPEHPAERIMKGTSLRLIESRKGETSDLLIRCHWNDFSRDFPLPSESLLWNYKDFKGVGTTTKARSGPFSLDKEKDASSEQMTPIS